ncbi:MAG: UDP-3-O-(3-hydroxymyristoyl)glucosamine N-acyltransferase [Alphaproteobacteria bacterium]|nr:UDP-3-O-(3-hydroxymyristoyl)glucosamine N-acyltransferase [Alphaproteobacteria bacterium]MBQ9234862.1 UDP-3-O-(3-hydroxymyristoyl)glucosamine N-acyltransferase [Alphaproteobacteria bacterium]
MVDNRFYKNNGPFSLGKIAEICSADFVGEAHPEVMIRDIGTITSGGKDEICFFFDRKKKELASQIKTAACITSPDFAALIPQGIMVLTCAKPHDAFVALNRAMYSEILPSPEVHPSAVVAASAKIGKDCYIGANAVVGENVVIGDNCILEANCTIGDSCVMGHHCRVGANANIMHAVLGNNVYIYGGARIGWDGFGFQTVNGVHERIPQLGRVIIGNDVEIGANSCVDRGALDDTIIGDGCRIDNLVQVAHNDQLGRGCILVAQVGVAGSCTFGNYVVCGGQVGFAGHIHIGDMAQIGAQSGVMRDVEAGASVMGSPAIGARDFMKQTAYIQKLCKK